MPPFFDQAQLNGAMRAEALPALERLAGNPGHLDLTRRRFDDDEPPPYESSTDEDYDGMMVRPEPLASSTLPSEITDLVDPPLDDNERKVLSRSLKQVYEPGRRYRIEVREEFEG